MGRPRDAVQREMELKNFSPKTMERYVYRMGRYALHCRKASDELGDQEIKTFPHFLQEEKKASQPSMSEAYSALKIQES